LRDNHGAVCGVALQDMAPGQQESYQVPAKVVINATGPWGDEVRETWTPVAVVFERIA
jgi:glycerol-3-phosphate dehydrogenase